LRGHVRVGRLTAPTRPRAHPPRGGKKVIVPPVEPTRVAGTSSLIDVLDRVLDKGIVIDAEVTLNVVGIALLSVEARILVAGFETYLEYADSFAMTPPVYWRTVARPNRRQAEVPPAPLGAGQSAEGLPEAGGEVR
jgi:hypothetical protein